MDLHLVVKTGTHFRHSCIYLVNVAEVYGECVLYSDRSIVLIHLEARYQVKVGVIWWTSLNTIQVPIGSRLPSLLVVYFQSSPNSSAASCKIWINKSYLEDILCGNEQEHTK